MIIFKLALRNLWRDKSATEIQILTCSLFIAITLSVAIACFNSRLNSAMNMRANEFLAADLVLESTSVISDKQAQIIQNFKQNNQLKSAQTVEFASVITTDDAMLLVSAKAVSDNYPLRGKLQTLTINNENKTNDIPNSGEIWLEERALTALNLKLGDEITLGSKIFVVGSIIISEPDRNNDFYSFNPGIMININDLPEAKIIAPGSRVKYRELLSGKTEELQQFKEQIKPLMLANQKILDVRKANNQIGSALKRAEQYLNLATMVAVLLSSVAIALSANRFAVKRFNNSALLRCLGLNFTQVLQFFIWQLLLLWVITSLLGLGLGYLVQLGLFYLLQNLIQIDLGFVGISPFVSGALIGLITLSGFSLPGIISLSKIPPLRVLRSDVIAPNLSLWLVYLLAICSLVAVMWYLALDITLILALIASGIGICVGFGVPLFYLMRLLRKYMINAHLALRMSLGQLLRYPLATIGQILAFGLILMCMSLIALLRTELLDDWRNQLPDNASNHFAFNIMPYELETFKKEISQITKHISPFYPIFMGRITEINGKKIDLNDKTLQKINALKRDLNLTISDVLPKDNLITAGNWFNNQANDKTYISVEEKLAKELKVKVGDSLTFQIAGKSVIAEITSLRKVNWENFLPNFFVIFAPQVANNFAITYLASFYVEQQDEPKLLPLAKQFPSATILPITELIKQLHAIVAQVTMAVEYVMLFVFAATIMVFLAGLQSSLEERMQSSTLLRVLGANRNLLRKIRIYEFALLGLFSGFVALIGCELMSFALYKWLFKLDWSFHLQLLGLPIIGLSVICAAGLLGNRNINSVSPLKILRSL